MNKKWVNRKCRILLGPKIEVASLSQYKNELQEKLGLKMEDLELRK